MSEIIYLDLNKCNLFGWETKKSESVIEAIIKGIENNNEFPAVPVHEEFGDYYLSPLKETHDGLPDGGHYRSLGHLESKKLLKCELLGGGPIWPHNMYIHISDISIVPDSGQFEEHKKRFPNYRI